VCGTAEIKSRAWKRIGRFFQLLKVSESFSNKKNHYGNVERRSWVMPRIFTCTLFLPYPVLAVEQEAAHVFHDHPAAGQIHKKPEKDMYNRAAYITFPPQFPARK
jgi:hypothetical protein